MSRRIPREARQLLVRLYARGPLPWSTPPPALAELSRRGLARLVGARVEVTPDAARRIETWDITPRGRLVGAQLIRRLPDLHALRSRQLAEGTE